MAREQHTLREVAWYDVFPGLHLFWALRAALGFRVLLLAAIAIVGTSAGWRLCGQLFRNTTDEHLQHQIEFNSAWPWQGALGHLPEGLILEPSSWFDLSPLVATWANISSPFVQVFRTEASLPQLAYWMLCALWTLVVWSFFGGAITRIAAVGFARQENVSWGNVAGFVRPRWRSYFGAPLMPLVGTFMIAVFLFLVGLLANPALGEVGILLTGLVWPLVLAAAFAMAFLLIWLFFGWPLMWGAISAEGTDSFGAISHSLSYTCQRPIRYLGYTILAGVIGVFGWYLVSLFAVVIKDLASWGVAWGSGAGRLEAVANDANLGTAGSIGSSLILFWNGCVTTLAVAFGFSYLWCSSTVVYFLLRRVVDATELDNVYMAEEQSLHGLPPLTTGADGVAEPADDEAADEIGGRARSLPEAGA